MRDFHPRRRMAAVALFVALAAVLGACGVPSSGPPIIDGNAAGGAGAAGTTPLPLPDGPSAATTPTELVNGYLSAIAGQTDPDAPSAEKAVKAFMTATAASEWRPSKTITVIRPAGTDALHAVSEGTETRVDGTFEVVGVLSPTEGTLEAPSTSSRGAIQLQFMVTGLQRSGDQPPDGSNASGLRLNKAPTGSYMSEDALVHYYQAQSVYFWDSSGDHLIPELRYVPQTISTNQAQSMVVRWVLAGPSDALGSAAQGIVNTTLVDPQVGDGGDRIIVDVLSTPKFTTDEQIRFGNQLRWSLLGMGPETGVDDPPKIDIYVDRQEQTLVADETSLRKANPVSERRLPAPEFAIGKGVARPVDGSQSQLLTSADNTNVRFAAVNSAQTNAALVRTSANGGAELWIRRGADKAHGFVRVLSAGSMTRPVWLSAPDGELAVVADGKLIFFDKHNRKSTPQLSGVGSIKAMSVAPDGQRIALVSSAGGLYTTVAWWQGAVATLLPARLLRSALSEANAVAWSKTDQLAVAGRVNGENRLVEINSDGTDLTNLDDPIAAPVTQVVAYPLDGRSRGQTDPVLFQTSNGARQVQPGEASVALVWQTKMPADVGDPTSPFFAD